MPITHFHLMSIGLVYMTHLMVLHLIELMNLNAVIYLIRNNGVVSFGDFPCIDKNRFSFFCIRFFPIRDLLIIEKVRTQNWHRFHWSSLVESLKMNCKNCTFIFRCVNRKQCAYFSRHKPVNFH